MHYFSQGCVDINLLGYMQIYARYAYEDVLKVVCI
jgi:hypothetical protein